MAMGRRKRERQETLFITAEQLPRSAGHPFYERLNRLLAEARFDDWIEARCRQYYEQVETRGQRSIPPGVYFRMLLVGYFEGIDSQRGIAWRCQDSLALRQFLGLGLHEATPVHASLTHIRRRLPEDVFDEVFQFVLRIAAEKKLLSGKTVGVDSTTLEANAAMKSIVRHDSGEDWKQYVTRLMQEEGAVEAGAQPTDDELRKFDKKRKNKRVSNEEWTSTTDPDAAIAKLKDGRTHLAYKAEHVVDLESDLLLAAEVRPADHGDAETLVDSVVQAQVNLDAAHAEATVAAETHEEESHESAAPRIEEVVADKGYHSASTLELAESLNQRTYVPEPKRPHRRRWTDKPEGQRRAVEANRRRVQRPKGRRLQRLRSERSFAHLCDSGGMRRSWLRGLKDVAKRYKLAAAAHNLGRILRALTGIGKPKALQGLGAFAALAQLLAHALLATLSLLLRTRLTQTPPSTRHSRINWLVAKAVR